jgi:hypothetical protein
MKNRRTRALVALATSALALTLAGTSAALAPSAHAASGGGCTGGSSGPAGTVYSCISASGYAQLVGDAHVYMNSVPSGCHITVNVWDWEFDYIVTSTTVPCGTSKHVVAPTYNGAYDWYYTEVIVNNGSPVWSPRQYMP